MQGSQSSHSPASGFQPKTPIVTLVYSVKHGLERMPEIAEVARIVHYLKKHAVGRVVSAVKTQEDDIIYGKVGTSASAFQSAITGKTIVDAKQQGKYFWLEMNSPPHPLMHFGMSGWMKFSNDSTAYYRPTKPEENEWPPKYWKFILQLKDTDCEVAFVDPRRLGRIRLVDAKAEDMRKTTPLKENGPDPVIDEDVLTVDWLSKKLRSKKVPVKALLLDQANISGIGNWVGDEILYQARLHPEQYSNTFSDEQIKQLHDAMMYVCKTAVEVHADSDKFPEDWLMKHRWGKGKNNGGKLPNGAKITFLKVGGRTSAVVPSVQKKTGAVAGDVSADTSDIEDESKPKRGSKRKSNAVKEEEDEEEEEDTQQTTPANTKRVRRKASEAVLEKEDDEQKPVAVKENASKGTKGSRKKAETTGTQSKEQDTGRRRSGRLARS
ncbi:putative Formamidopyrimidine-DNA glycosylase [Sporormia fimetaria CBS 119925]|uniref:Formamidopyrimidine-DNA glycosylase n=1 Tax=Sporormia fimetaria CBS 119925 TaxID=1340428 RepID=A0A6A6V6C1_9PLEO|nr:putative Formamidopyrimidine-DNA glycosylase [Sporormia fimetaria CBS 119925]